MNPQSLILIFLIAFPATSQAQPITCITQDNNTVAVTMSSPHPKEALVYRPSGEVVWLQAEDGLAHEQIRNFATLEKWIITPGTLGTVYIDGIPGAEPVIREPGRHHLYIADNTETESENTRFIECHFEIRQ